MKRSKRISFVTNTVSGDLIQHEMLPEVVHSFGFNDTDNNGLLDFNEFKEFMAQVGILRVIRSKFQIMLAENAYSLTYQLGLSDIVLEDNNLSKLNKNSDGNITRRRGSMVEPDAINFFDLKEIHEIDGITIIGANLFVRLVNESHTIIDPQINRLINDIKLNKLSCKESTVRWNRKVHKSNIDAEPDESEIYGQYKEITELDFMTAEEKEEYYTQKWLTKRHQYIKEQEDKLPFKPQVNPLPSFYYDSETSGGLHRSESRDSSGLHDPLRKYDHRPSVFIEAAKHCTFSPYLYPNRFKKPKEGKTKRSVNRFWEDEDKEAEKKMELKKKMDRYMSRTQEQKKNWNDRIKANDTYWVHRGEKLHSSPPRSNSKSKSSSRSELNANESTTDSKTRYPYEEELEERLEHNRRMMPPSPTVVDPMSEASSLSEDHVMNEEQHHHHQQPPPPPPPPPPVETPEAPALSSPVPPPIIPKEPVEEPNKLPIFYVDPEAPPTFLQDETLLSRLRGAELLEEIVEAPLEIPVEAEETSNTSSDKNSKPESWPDSIEEEDVDPNYRPLPPRRVSQPQESTDGGWNSMLKELTAKVKGKSFSLKPPSKSPVKQKPKPKANSRDSLIDELQQLLKGRKVDGTPQSSPDKKSEEGGNDEETEKDEESGEVVNEGDNQTQVPFLENGEEKKDDGDDNGENDINIPPHLKKKYDIMHRMQMPEGSIRQRMVLDGLSFEDADNYFANKNKTIVDTEDEGDDNDKNNNDNNKTENETEKADTAPSNVEVDFTKYTRMKKLGLPNGAIKQKMLIEGLSDGDIAKFFDGKVDVPDDQITKTTTTTNQRRASFIIARHKKVVRALAKNKSKLGDNCGVFVSRAAEVEFDLKFPPGVYIFSSIKPVMPGSVLQEGYVHGNIADGTVGEYPEWDDKIHVEKEIKKENDIKIEKTPESPNDARMAQLEGDRRRSRTNSVGPMSMSAPSSVTGSLPAPDDMDAENNIIASNFDETYKRRSITEDKDKRFTSTPPPPLTNTTTTTGDGINAHTRRSSTMKRAELDFTAFVGEPDVSRIQRRQKSLNNRLSLSNSMDDLETYEHDSTDPGVSMETISPEIPHLNEHMQRMKEAHIDRDRRQQFKKDVSYRNYEPWEVEYDGVLTKPKPFKDHYISRSDNKGFTYRKSTVLFDSPEQEMQMDTRVQHLVSHGTSLYTFTTTQANWMVSLRDYDKSPTKSHVDTHVDNPHAGSAYSPGFIGDNFNHSSQSNGALSDTAFAHKATKIKHSNPFDKTQVRVSRRLKWIEENRRVEEARKKHKEEHEKMYKEKLRRKAMETAQATGVYSPVKRGSVIRSVLKTYERAEHMQMQAKVNAQQTHHYPSNHDSPTQSNPLGIMAGATPESTLSRMSRESYEKYIKMGTI